MARDEDGLPRRCERTKEIAQPPDPLGIQPVRGLIENEQLRISEQRTGNAQALPHAERIAADRALGDIRNSDETQHLVDATSRNAGGGGENAQVISTAAFAVIVRRLEHGAHTTHRRVELAIRLSVDRDTAGRRMDEPEQDPQRCRLARTVRPEETGNASARNCERQPVDRGRLAIPLVEVDDLYHAGILGRRKALEQPSGLRDVRDLQLAGDDCPVAQ